MQYRKSLEVVSLLLVTALLILPGTAGDEQVIPEGDFTSEILPVFYVSDSRKSVVFYRNLGFHLNSHYDYEAGKDVAVWVKESPPIYTEMAAGDQKFAIHLIGAEDTLQVGGMKHYFGVSDVDTHHRLVVGNGISTSEIYDRPWMRMFYVEDPDGHVIFFFTRPER